MKATQNDMRGHLLDCGADPDDLETRDDIEVTREIDRFYEGGLRQFERDLIPVSYPRTISASFAPSCERPIRGEVIA